MDSHKIWGLDRMERIKRSEPLTFVMEYINSDDRETQDTFSMQISLNINDFKDLKPSIIVFSQEKYMN